MMSRCELQSHHYFRVTYNLYILNLYSIKLIVEKLLKEMHKLHL